MPQATLCLSFCLCDAIRVAAQILDCMVHEDFPLVEGWKQRLLFHTGAKNLEHLLTHSIFWYSETLVSLKIKQLCKAMIGSEIITNLTDLKIFKVLKKLIMALSFLIVLL